MPRDAKVKMKHLKRVKRNGSVYLYFNTGEKVDGKPIYKALGKEGGLQVGANYSVALAARSRRGSNAPSGLKVPELIDRFQRSPDFTGHSVGTQRTYGVYLKRLRQEFDRAPANGVEQSDILILMDDMAGKPAAIDMMLLAGGQMYEWAKARKYVAHNPFAEIDREAWEGQAYEPWPEVVLEAALNDSRLRHPVALLYYTAQRIGDCCKAEWDDMKPPRADEGEIYVRQQKTGKELWIPIHSSLQAILDEIPRRGPTILTDEKGKKRQDQTIRSWIKAFGAERGLDLVPHGLRKNAVNALLEADCSTGETSSISGQSLRMVEHYAKQRNSRRMGKRAMAKWERAANRETTGKTVEETADS